jgi:oleate hydratase
MKINSPLWQLAKDSRRIEMSGGDRSEPSGSPDGIGDENPIHHIVGGGIASLAAATFLVRDAGIPGERIRIYEQSEVFGGSVDGGGSSESGYVIRGGRMFERNFVCTFDLFSSIPSLEVPGKTIKEEMNAFNHDFVTCSHCRLVRNGGKADISTFGFSARDLLDLTRLLMRSERSLAGTTIEACFSDGFFRTNFWFIWSTTFAFQPWHSAMEFKRYMLRFVHLFPGLKKLEGILRTPYNQYDSLVVPIVVWLKQQGVRFRPNHQVTDLDVVRRDGVRQVTALHIIRDGERETMSVSGRDRVFLTLGSITECSSFGSTSAPPSLRPVEESGAWNLWRRLAERDAVFGRPTTFCGDIGRTSWESFTVTLRGSDFFEFMQSFTDNAAGTGGLVTFTDSNWLMSIVLARHPHFRGQPDDVYVFWGYGLFPDRPGNYVGKPMSQCSGQEILRELSGHLRLEDKAERLLGGAISIPCMMPFITSQFMPRSVNDRPPVIPERASNFAVMGQFCEIAGDVVFTVEYSVRSAMIAVYSLLNVEKEVPELRRPHREPSVLFQAVKTVLRG